MIYKEGEKEEMMGRMKEEWQLIWKEGEKKDGVMGSDVEGREEGRNYRKEGVIENDTEERREGRKDGKEEEVMESDGKKEASMKKER